mmetsp:Transcript_110925/g.318671  ORF Transcript_110925/g.318671 Transcript_110925/m.318671 type:complete len:518 (+) Transcript_110925:100-1653(+)
MLHQTSPAAAHGQQQSKADMGNGDLSRNSNIATPLRAGLARRLPAGACQQPSSPQQGGLPGSPMQFTVVQAGPASPHQLPARAFSPSQRVQLPGTTGPDVSPIASPHHEEKQDAAKVSVIAPGGGTGINGQVYHQLGLDRAFVVDIVGHSRAPYDCYPERWSNGGPPPNLESFAGDVLRQRWAERSDCFVFGSRGGQVVLPFLWERMQASMPPVVCINGGCAMSCLPRKVHWPEAAVSFLLLGGQDYFRGNASIERYIADTKASVPPTNRTTAILLVNEMEHMPQAPLLGIVLPLMLKAILRWKRPATSPPCEHFRKILKVLNGQGWSGRFMFTSGRDGEWAPEVDFGPFSVQPHVATERDIEATRQHEQVLESSPIQMTRKSELKELFRAAVREARPSQGAPLAHKGDKLVAAAQAAAQAAHAERERRRTSPPVQVHQSPERKKLTMELPPRGMPLPIGVAASPVSPSNSPSAQFFFNGGPMSPISSALGMHGRLAPSQGSPLSPTSPTFMPRRGF